MSIFFKEPKIRADHDYQSLNRYYIFIVIVISFGRMLPYLEIQFQYGHWLGFSPSHKFLFLFVHFFFLKELHIICHEKDRWMIEFYVISGETSPQSKGIPNSNEENGD